MRSPDSMAGLATTMRVANALSTIGDSVRAAEEAARRAADGLDGLRPDLICLFVTGHHAADMESIVSVARDRLAPVPVVGCTAEWVVGEGREVEDGPAVSVWAASLPGAHVEPFHLELVQASDGPAFVGFPDTAERGAPAAVLLVGDPFTFPAESVLGWASSELPGVPVIGGLASAARSPGGNRLVAGDRVFREGAVGVAIWGDVVVRTVVSQGCRPVGDSFVVTRADRNVLLELAGKPALERLRETVERADVGDRMLLAQGVLVGIVIDEYKETFERGDFLVRPVMGGDVNSGALAVGERVDVGQTVRFHVRDAASAGDDLVQLLSTLDMTPSGALLFTCNGRGSRMFGRPGHDVETILACTGELPIGGFFCAGEIGPVGGRNFLHGFTASAVFFGETRSAL